MLASFMGDDLFFEPTGRIHGAIIGSKAYKANTRNELFEVPGYNRRGRIAFASLLVL
jgi:hypothetical protein